MPRIPTYSTNLSAAFILHTKAHQLSQDGKRKGKLLVDNMTIHSKLAQNPFATIPQEIILSIAQYLLPPDLNSLILTSREFYGLLDGLLYNAALTWKCKDRTVFEWAAITGQLAVVQKLLARSAGAHDSNEPAWRVIRLAALHGHAEIVELLLDAGFPLTQGRNEDTTLHFAVHSGSKKTVEVVIGSGIDVSTPGYYEKTALHLAASSGDIEIVRSLLAAGAGVSKPDQGGYTVLHCACLRGSIDACRVLLDAGAKLSAKSERGTSAFHCACAQGHVEVAQLLITEYKKSGLDIQETNSRSWTALFLAVENNHELVVELLMENGMDPTISFGNNTALHYAVWLGHTSLLKLFLEKGVDVETTDENGETPVHWAASRGQVGALKLLLDHGANFQKAAVGGVLPLHRAAANGRESAIKMLIEHGADIDARGGMLATPLLMAVYHEYDSVCQLLVSLGADITLPDTQGSTPLKKAVEMGKPSLVRVFLEKLQQQGGTIDPQGRWSGTPLHSAVEVCNLGLIDLLMSFGADPLQLDGYGRSCIDWAYLHQASWEVMKKYCTYQTTDQTLAMATLRGTIKGLAAYIKGEAGEWDIAHHLHHLGKSLIIADDLTEARIALEQSRSGMFPDWSRVCDLCTQFIDGDLHVCLTCPTIDICTDCTGTYQNWGVSSHRCQGHQLLCVPPTRGEFNTGEKVNGRGESLQEWLTRIEMSYGTSST